MDIIAKCVATIVKVGARGSLIRKGTEMVQAQAAPVEKVVIHRGQLICGGFCMD